MPKRTDIKTILVIGSGPVVNRQGWEFAYSGVQACKALRREGYRVVLINSNPATIMTDPEFADATYVEPMTPEVLKMIIEKERPDALLPTMGGQTALNLAMDLYHNGTLEKYGVEMIGATAEAIDIAEDRKRFKEVIAEIGLRTPISEVVGTLDEAVAAAVHIGYAGLIRPACTPGGSGGGVAYNPDDLTAISPDGLSQSPFTRVVLW